ncbi:DUF2785 domain-containing protein [Microbacterium esteraromaticum]|uniref:DUF2785 domain-containing protein n=2 Tax=Microbacterium esteraromaticum TaxID=57043 RepID=A0A7D7WER5_9MICO|nr:DUF2785 domain-containing protein [Microbacterium esteraromaticum]
MSVGLHHVEVWLAGDAAAGGWPWLLERLGFVRVQSWADGESWSAGGAYLTLTRSPTLSADRHDRRRPGVNHLAFHGGSRGEVDALMEVAPQHGWSPLYADRYPHAGGEAHYAGWLENSAGFKVEVVARANSAAGGAADAVADSASAGSRMLDETWLSMAAAGLSSVSSDAREAALDALCEAVASGRLDDRLVALIERRLLALEVGLGEDTGDSVFGRSFSALVLGACVARTNVLGLRDGIDRWCAAFVRWFVAERDVRGYVEGRGWAHAIAHGADAWGEFARFGWRDAGIRELLRDAVIERAMAATGPWTAGEADRIALAISSVPGAAAGIAERLNSAVAGAQRGAADPYAQTFNAEQLLRALLLQAEPGSPVDTAIRRGVQERYPHLQGGS